MLIRTLLSIALLAAVPVWAQVDEPMQGGPMSGAPMLTPAAVAGEAYPTIVGAEARSNYLDAGVVFSTAYVDNLFAGSATAPVSNYVFSVRPVIALDQTTFRQHRTFTYSPGYTKYSRTSVLNQADQSLDVEYKYRVAPYLSLRVGEIFSKRSGSLNPLGTGAATPVSGAAPVATLGAIAPFADQISNTVTAGMIWQTSRNVMIGASGGHWKLDYPHPSQTPGLYDSSSRSGSGFYAVRLSSDHYFGVAYRYVQMFAYPEKTTTETVTHTSSLFYAFLPAKNVSLTIAAGPQHFNLTAPPLRPSGSWEPSLEASVALQGTHTNLTAGYTREVTGGGGLLGAFHSDTTHATGRWQMTRNWVANATAMYVVNTTVTPLLLLATPGGRSVTASGSLERRLSQQLKMSFEYDHLRQKYNGIAALASHPDSNSGMVSVTWEFRRPLGR